MTVHKSGGTANRFSSGPAVILKRTSWIVKEFQQFQQQAALMEPLPFEVYLSRIVRTRFHLTLFVTSAFETASFNDPGLGQATLLEVSAVGHGTCDCFEVRAINFFKAGNYS